MASYSVTYHRVGQLPVFISVLTDEINEQSPLKNAEAALSECADLQSAVSRLKALLLLEPGDPQLLGLLSTFMLKTELYSVDAFKLILRAVANDLYAANLRYTLGMNYFIRGKTPDAVREWTVAIALRPNSIESRYASSMLVGTFVDQAQEAQDPTEIISEGLARDICSYSPGTIANLIDVVDLNPGIVDVFRSLSHEKTGGVWAQHNTMAALAAVGRHTEALQEVTVDLLANISNDSETARLIRQISARLAQVQ